MLPAPHRAWRCNCPYKYAEGSASRVVEDLRLNHNRAVAKAYVQTVADAVAAVAMVKEEQWNYQLPELPANVTTIGIGIDGTCLLIYHDGWREAMVGMVESRGIITFRPSLLDPDMMVSSHPAPDVLNSRLICSCGYSDDSFYGWLEGS